MTAAPTVADLDVIANLVGLTDIAHRAGVSFKTASKWDQRRDKITGDRATPMPDPVGHISGRFAFWWWPEVEAWLEETGRSQKRHTHPVT